MKKLVLGVLACGVLAACAPAVPDSAAGVGFDDYSTFQKRQAAQRAAMNSAALPAPSNVVSEPLGVQSESEVLAAQTRAALGATGSTPAPVIETATVAAADPVAAPEISNGAGISKENNFDAVSAERSIESDAERLARIRADYQVVQPTALPSRDGTVGPNLAEYALQTTNAPGEALYKRSVFNTQAKYERNCAQYPSPDMAQSEFLKSGGPQKDRKGLDPDGDGFACSWDPISFRKAIGG